MTNILKLYRQKKDKSTLEERIQLLEDLQAEYLVLDKTLDPDVPASERRKAAKEKVAQLQQRDAKIVNKEIGFEEKLGIRRYALEKERNRLAKYREELEMANEEDRKVIDNKNTTPAEKERTEEWVAQREREIRRITA